jgi:hypothetical protein
MKKIIKMVAILLVMLGIGGFFYYYFQLQGPPPGYYLLTNGFCYGWESEGRTGRVDIETKREAIKSAWNDYKLVQWKKDQDHDFIERTKTRGGSYKKINP